MTELLAALASMVVLLLADWRRPSSARCPAGWMLLEGVRPNGEFACFTPMDPPGCGDLEGTNVPCKRPHRVSGRIYCTNGQQPIINDGWVTVGCQARH